MRVEALPNGWLALRQYRLDGKTLPLILLHPTQGIAIIGGPADGPALLRARLAAGRFDAIFPGHLPVLRLDQAADPGPAFAALPPLTLPGGDAWVGVVRRALETAPEPAPVVPRRSWARRRRLRRRLGMLGGAAGLAALAAAAWVASLPPGAFRPAGTAQLTRPAKPVAAPEAAAGRDPVHGMAAPGAPFELAAAPQPDIAAAPATADTGMPPDQRGNATLPPVAPDMTLLVLDEPADAAVPAAAAPKAAAAAELAAPTAHASPQPAVARSPAPDEAIVQAAAGPTAPGIPPGPAAVAALMTDVAPMRRSPDAPRPLAKDVARPAASAARPASREPVQDRSAIRPAAASIGLPGRCRLIIQRLQIGDNVADGDIRLLKRGCAD